MIMINIISKNILEPYPITFYQNAKKKKKKKSHERKNIIKNQKLLININTYQHK